MKSLIDETIHYHLLNFQQALREEADCAHNPTTQAQLLTLLAWQSS